MYPLTHFRSSLKVFPLAHFFLNLLAHLPHPNPSVMLSFIAYLLAHRMLARVGDAVGALLSSPWVIKLGVAFEDDLKLLRSSYPALRCFDTCHGLLDGGLLLQVMSSPARP